MVCKRKRERSSEDLINILPHKSLYNKHCCIYKSYSDLADYDPCPCSGYSKQSNISDDDDDDLDKSHYDKWNARVDICQYLSWYKSRDLACLLKWIRKINYADPKCRLKALDKLDMLCDRAPYSRVARFPETFYVLEGSGQFAKRLAQLICLLEVQEFPVVQKNGQKKDVKEVCKCFRSAATDILGILSKGTDVFDRKKFELFFEVVWTEKSKSKPCGGGSGCVNNTAQLTDDDDSFD